VLVVVLVVGIVVFVRRQKNASSSRRSEKRHGDREDESSSSSVDSDNPQVQVYAGMGEVNSSDSDEPVVLTGGEGEVVYTSMEKFSEM
jgi:hypothetical protein